jgi:hypothetical protein
MTYKYNNMIPTRIKESYMLKKNLATTIRFYKGQHDDVYEFLQKRQEPTVNKAIMAIIKEYIQMKKAYKSKKTSIRIDLIEDSVKAKIVDVQIIEDEKEV